MDKALKEILNTDFTKYQQELANEKTTLEKRLAKVTKTLEAVESLIIIQNG